MAPSSNAHARGLWRRLILNNARFIAIELRKIADQLDKAAPGPPAVALLLLHSPEGEIALSEITVKDDSAPLTATLQLLDAKGNPTTADDVPTWTSSDEDVATLAVSDDGLQAEATIVGKMGSSLITVSSTEATNQQPITAVGTINVIASDVAVSGDVSFTAPA